MTNLINITAARIQSLPDLQQVPPEKIAKMIMRTLIGTLFVVIGLLLLVIQISLLYKSQDIDKLSLWLLGGAVFMIILGATTWSSQIVLTPLKILSSFLREIVSAVKGNSQE